MSPSEPPVGLEVDAVTTALLPELLYFKNEPLVCPVPPFATGRVPLTWLVKLTPDNVPPRVRLPEEVTVPLSVMPLTVPVPPTEVTVPDPPVAAMLMPPAELVIVMLEPAVKLATV